MEGSFALDLIVEGGRCRGVVAAERSGRRTEVRARNVLVATGGYGQLFAVTTNPEEATGDGVAMAIRAGVAVADVEFEQFHPTALHHPVMPRPLLTEALRGHGALLRDAQRRAVRRRAAAARQGEQGDHGSDARPGGRAPVAGRHRAGALRRAVPDHRGRAQQGGARPGRRLAPDRAGRALQLRWDPRRPERRVLAARACGWPARRAATASWAPTAWPPTRCSTGWCSDPGWSRRSTGASRDPSATGAMRALLGRRRDRRACHRGPAGGRHDGARPRHAAAHHDDPRRRAPVGGVVAARRPRRAPARPRATIRGPGSCATSPPWADCSAPRRSPGRRAAARTPARTSTRDAVTSCASGSSPAADQLASVGMTDASPAAWHPDPYGRHELRYWDGARWTEHVSSHGKQSVDPPAGAGHVPTGEPRDREGRGATSTSPARPPRRPVAARSSPSRCWS